MYFLGCDAGSTKTELLITDERGAVAAHGIYPACNYLMTGREAFARAMREAIRVTLEKAELDGAQLTYSVYGLPAYEESAEMRGMVPEALGAYAQPMHTLICGDEVIGFAGSLGGKPGINVVAGTGSVVYGENEKRDSARVGGWSLLFDDVGSCCWMGRQLLSIFFRQADGRMPRGPVYELFRERFDLQENHWDFVGEHLPLYNADRTALAALQRMAGEAVERGDAAAADLFEQAARGLCEMVSAVTVKLSSSGASAPMDVSYSGGLFRNGARILEPFGREIEVLGLRLVRPAYSPVVGALALGARQYLSEGSLQRMLSRAQRETAEG